MLEGTKAVVDNVRGRDEDALSERQRRIRAAYPFSGRCTRDCFHRLLIDLVARLPLILPRPLPSVGEVDGINDGYLVFK
jgi:hypothetical protein